jgi:hypothetical protein
MGITHFDEEKTKGNIENMSKSLVIGGCDCKNIENMSKSHSLIALLATLTPEELGDERNE